MKKEIYHGGTKRRFFSYFYFEITLYCAELFECALNLIFLFLNMKTLNIKGAKFEFYMKKPIIEGASMERSANLLWLHFSNLLPLFRK